MFRIRGEQLQHFGALAKNDFEGRMVDYFASTFPEESAKLDLPVWVARNVERSLAFNIDMEREVAQYLLFCLRLGEAAPLEDPSFSTTLKRRDLSPDGKMRALVRMLAERADDQKIPDLNRFVMKPFA